MDSDKRFRELIDRSFTGEISERERQLIQAHIRDCDDCKHYLELTARTIRGLREIAFAAGLESHVRVQDILAHHTATMRQHNVRLKVRTAFALTLSMSLVGSLIACWGARLLAVHMHFGIAQVQAGVLVFWLLPSVCAALSTLVAPGENRGIA
jgi:predicted anti-sigma-YlaC factor YlaD